jgi:tetratricopeptide (TPR) repeat protein
MLRARARPAWAGEGGFLEKGIAERRQGYFEQSMLSLQKFLRAHGNHAQAWYELGITYASDGQYGKAADAYRLALSHGFAEPQCHCALSLALREIAKPMASSAEARRCLDLIPDYAGAWNLIGNAEIDLGHYREAQQAYAEAVRLKPMYGNARFNLGLALGALGRDAEAELAFQETRRRRAGRGRGSSGSATQGRAERRHRDRRATIARRIEHRHCVLSG